MRDLKIKSLLLSLAVAMPVFAVQATNDTKQDIQDQLDVLQKRLGELEAKEGDQKATKKGNDITFYGSLRPALTYSDFGDQGSVDVTDFFSRLGFKGDVAINDGLTAFYRGEWDIDVEADSDFGDARLAYVGLKGAYGAVAIGKQWSPHYNIVAEVTDIFNNRSSPFAYDEASPFRTNQMVTYSYNKGGFKLDAGLQFNGNSENSAGGDNSQSNLVNYVDSGSIGVGYDFGDVYVGASYLSQHLTNVEKRTFRSVAGAWQVTDDVYFAATYQDITRSLTNMEYEQSSLDIAASFALPKDFTFKTSYFDWDGDGFGRSFTGYNLTLENQLNDSVKVFVEWLSRDIKDADTQTALSVGIRYDFETIF